jgi:hypothetical protein
MAGVAVAEVLTKRDIEDMLENEAYRLAAAGHKYNGGILYRFYEEQREKRGFDITITRRQVDNWVKKWKRNGGPRPRTDFRNMNIDDGEY